eukprot:1095146-Pyramimonas_sp.AAC.1
MRVGRVHPTVGVPPCTPAGRTLSRGAVRRPVFVATRALDWPKAIERASRLIESDRFVAMTRPTRARPLDRSRRAHGRQPSR